MRSAANIARRTNIGFSICVTLRVAHGRSKLARACANPPASGNARPPFPFVGQVEFRSVLERIPNVIAMAGLCRRYSVGAYDDAVFEICATEPTRSCVGER